MSLTLIQTAVNARFMKHIHRYIHHTSARSNADYCRCHRSQQPRDARPAQNQNWLTLKNIRTDKATTFYADNRTDRAWFVEAVLPTGHYADNRADRAWFVEAVLPTGDSNVVTENLKSVAATL